MGGKITYWASVILGFVALGLLVADVSIINSNRKLQEEVNARQTEINKGLTLSQINQGLVQALAEAVIAHNDGSIRELLAAQGITVKQGGEGKADAAAAPANTDSKK